MCELYYLNHFREAVAEAASFGEGKSAVIVDEDTAESDPLPERLAKVMLDTSFVKIDQVSSLEARQRLLRYAVELCRKLRNDVNIELDFAAVIKEQLDSKEVD